MEKSCKPNLAHRVYATAALVPYHKNDNCKMYSRKPKALEPAKPLFLANLHPYQRHSSPTLTQLAETDNVDDTTVDYLISPFGSNEVQFGKISYQDDDRTMATTYDPEQDRDLNSFKYEEPHLIITNVRSLKRKAGTDKQNVPKKSSSTASTSIASSLPQEQKHSGVTGPRATTLTKSPNMKLPTKGTIMLKSLTELTAAKVHTIALAKKTPPPSSKPPLLLTRTPAPSTLLGAKTIVLPKSSPGIITTHTPLMKLAPETMAISTPRSQFTATSIVMKPSSNIMNLLAMPSPGTLQAKTTTTPPMPSQIKTTPTSTFPKKADNVISKTVDLTALKNNSVVKLGLKSIHIGRPTKAQSKESVNMVKTAVQGSDGKTTFLWSPVQEKAPANTTPTILQENKIGDLNANPTAKETSVSPGKQHIVLKRIKIVNPSNVAVDMNEIIKHIQSTGLPAGKTADTKTKWLPIPSADKSARLEACTIPMTRMQPLQNTVMKPNSGARTQSAFQKATTKFIIRKINAADLTTGATAGAPRAVESVPMKKRVDSKILKAALLTARKKNVSEPTKNKTVERPPKPPPPEFGPGSENFSCLYLKVEEPYPDENGVLVEPSLSLIERTLNQTSMRAEDTTTWSSKNVEALGIEGMNLKTAPKPVDAKAIEEVNDKVTDPVRPSSPAEFNPLSDRPDTSDSEPEPIEGESVTEKRKEDEQEILELDQVYTEACNYNPKRKKARYLFEPNPDDVESVVVYLKKKLDLANEENADLLKDLRTAKKLIARLKDTVLQFKLARGLTAKKGAKTKIAKPRELKSKESNSTSDFVEPNDDFWK